ncbi:unnamed protein product [Brassica oleracea]|uniref:Auxin-responsive protein n=1 Tax=Brassica napus TaxID=3708 RepID=A0A816RVX6_BRANA|nr:unnamed protein product [Brassica napus]
MSTPTFPSSQIYKYERAERGGLKEHNYLGISDCSSYSGIDLGWPPVRSFRKNTLAATCSAAFFVKVSMDGAPYLRKVDLKSYTNYMELSTALEKMFTTFTLGQCGSNKATRKDKLCETKLKDLLNGKDSMLSYEDKDGDWMLVGDVPWEMFIDVCKKKIMKGCDAIGLAAAPRAMWRNRR